MATSRYGEGWNHSHQKSTYQDTLPDSCKKTAWGKVRTFPLELHSAPKEQCNSLCGVIKTRRRGNDAPSHGGFVRHPKTIQFNLFLYLSKRFGVHIYHLKDRVESKQTMVKWHDVIENVKFALKTDGFDLVAPFRLDRYNALFSENDDASNINFLS